MQERRDNDEIESHNHNEYPLLYKEAEISTSSLGKFLECRKCYILLVTCALVIYLICMPSALGHTYQANPSCPCYNYYMYALVPMLQLLHKILLVLVLAKSLDTKFISVLVLVVVKLLFSFSDIYKEFVKVLCIKSMKSL